MTISQQAFLRDAMRRLNLTRDVFATRIGVKRRALDTWLLPEGSQEFRAMPEVVQRFVSEIVQNGVLLENIRKAYKKGRCVNASRWKASINCCRWTSSPGNRWKTCSVWPT